MEIDNYPTGKIILSYALLDGAIGGTLLGILMTVIEYPGYTNLDETFGGLLIGIFSFAVYGIFYGLIPAITTGLFVTNRKIYLGDKTSFIKIFMLGFIISGFLTAVMTVVFLYKEIFNWLKYIFIFGTIGGLSSLIVGILFLPKEKIHAKK